MKRNATLLSALFVGACLQAAAAPAVVTHIDGQEVPQLEAITQAGYAPAAELKAAAGFTAAQPKDTGSSTNATMSYDVYDKTTGTTTTTTVDVTVTQVSDSLITVDNFLGFGYTVEIGLYGSKRATIATQVVYSRLDSDSTTNIDYYIYSVDYTSGYSGVSSYTSPIVCDAASDLRTISWGDWNMIYSYNSSLYWTGTYYTGGKIETTFDLSYPAASEFSLSGSGTQSSPYEISDAKQWNALADYMANMYETFSGSYFKITDDIDFSSEGVTPLGTDAPFAAALNGNGKTLKGIDATVSDSYGGAVISATGSGARIYDLTAEGTVSLSGSYTGGLIGKLYYSTLSDVTCNLTVNDTTSSDRCVAAMAGYVYHSTVSDCVFGGTLNSAATFTAGLTGFTSYSTLSNCVNKGAVNVTGTYGGGVSAYVYYYSELTGCYNEGTVTSEGDCCGGVCAFAYYGSVLSQCYNAGTVTQGASYGGGVCGYIYSATMSYCYNKGTVTSTGNYASGIVAECLSGVVKNCYSTVEASVTGKSYACGIVGIVQASTITDVTNAGPVTAQSPYGGGVIGYSAGYNTFTTCVNDSTGTITSYQYGGGVAGYLAKYDTATGLINYADLTCSTSYCGGIVGLIEGYSSVSSNSSFSTYVSLSDSYNYGNITGAGLYTAGVVGKCGYYCTFTNCGNYGNVHYTGTTQRAYTGGFIGYVSDRNTFISCFNEGDITIDLAKGNYVGGFAGYLDRGYFIFTDCHNGGDISCYNYVAGLTAGFTSTTYVTVTGFYNTGNITATCTTTSGSGPAGVMTKFPVGCSFTGCWNSGTITSYGPKYASGCFGANNSKGTADGVVTISGCYNTGKIIGQNTYTAGVIGYNTSCYSTVTDCWNTGEIEGHSGYTGGVFGCVDSEGPELTISGCWNAGTVTDSCQYVGGVAGYISNPSTVNEAANHGTVSSTDSYVGGVAGYCATALADAYNTGSITGGNYVGGVIGGTALGGTTLSSAYSTGTITCDSVCGNVLGVDTADELFWGEGNSVSSAYYLAATAVDTTVTHSTALTYAELGALELSGWTNGDDYTYPVLDDNDYALANAAAVVPADGDSYDSITKAFHVGTPDGVTWTSSVSGITFDGDSATFTQTVQATVTLTATCGEVSVDTQLTCDVEVEVGDEDGVSVVGDDSRTVVSEKFYSVSGSDTTVPADGQKAIYIVVRTYDDGTTEAVKEVR